MTKTTQASSRPPTNGDVANVRMRTWLVEGVEPSPSGTIARLACLDDDAQGEVLEVVWELELQPRILDEEAWKAIGAKGFDEPRLFGAYVHTLRWNCVTATDPKLFQAPFRAGIRVDAYQLEPLRKALLLPRVNLFIADDVGLGKTIEAGLIASELLLRRRVRDIVVACPPTMLLQWRDELEARFGLTFQILDRAYVEQVRREHGYGVNPWTTFPRFLVSHRLLIDEAYAGPLRAWLDNMRPGSLLILDEAHHAAPSSGSRYAIDTRITGAVRDLSDRFEHRLFLSATPHNGHSNSFSALLEILDRNRFTRGVKVRAKQLDEVMVRRLKEDIREIAGGFPKRTPKQHDVAGLPEDAPELQLARLLDEYRQVRQLRLAEASKRKQAEAGLLMSGLQQRLFSSIDAFARTLQKHRATMERLWAGETLTVTASTEDVSVLHGGLDRDDDLSLLPAEEQAALEESAMVSLTAATSGDALRADIDRERVLLDEMARIGEAARGLPDARVRLLIAWLREHCCRGLRDPGRESAAGEKQWSDIRVLIFTEYEDTRRYLVEMLRSAAAGTHRAEERIAVFSGHTSNDRREIIKRAFNLSPSEHPLRILVATDAAREGINLQAHCWNLFHFDLPWNPSRLEQRNGRIDRKLQPQDEVFCHYFVYTQRPEDRILKVLVRKTEIIQRELGSLSAVLEDRLADMLRGGIRRNELDQLEQRLSDADLDQQQKATVAEELDAARERQDALRRQIDTLRNRINDAMKWIGYDTDALRDALSCALELSGAAPLRPVPSPPGEPLRYELPALGHGGDGSWMTTLDALRKPPEDGDRSWQWRRTAGIRPVILTPPKGVDDDVVQLHLQHRVVQRLLGRFVAQGFVHHDLSRACLAQTEDAVPRVVLLGRLSLYGAHATRLHEELLTVAARWIDPGTRKGVLTPYGRDAEGKTLALLEQALRPGSSGVSEQVQNRLLESLPSDVGELLAHLEVRGETARKEAEGLLTRRGEVESESMRAILEEQRRRVTEQQKRSPQIELELVDATEKRQFEADRRAWKRFLENVDADLKVEPERIRSFYTVVSWRLEPIGLAYLWPVTG